MYKLEWYDFKENVGRGLINDIIYSDLKIAVEDAKEIFMHQISADKAHISVLVNEIDENGEIIQQVEEIGGFNYEI